MKRLTALLAIFLLVVTLGMGLVHPKKAHASFVANNLIADGAFDFVNSMNTVQIDSFLNSFPNSCISPNSGFEAVVPTGYTPNGGFTYGAYVSAGSVIATAAQVYGINPQVLLVTLQKEQSLVQGGAGYCDNGDENKYAAAVGYGCPDSGTVHSYTDIFMYRRNGVPHTNTGPTCVNSAAKAGFSQQVIRAAWLLKFGQQRSLGRTGWAVISGSWDNSDDLSTCYGGPMTQGVFKRCASESSPTAYDGWITIDGLATHMDTGGTAALYWYTPHFHGNQNFVNLFESWFGSTQSPATCTGSETPGTYVRRFYNPRTFEHFYSAYDCDIPFLQRIGFINEAPVFNTTPCDAGYAVPVYRYYNPQTGQHMWNTLNENQAQLDAGGTGYKVEAGIVFCTARSDSGAPNHVIRYYNPTTFLHLWGPPASPADQDILNRAGYTQVEGTVFWAQ